MWRRPSRDGVRTRIGLVLPLLSWRVTLPDSSRVACRAYSHRGQSGIVHVSYCVEVEGAGERSVRICSYGGRRQEHARQMTQTVAGILDLPISQE